MREVLLYMALSLCFCSQVWPRPRVPSQRPALFLLGRWANPGLRIFMPFLACVSVLRSFPKEPQGNAGGPGGAVATAPGRRRPVPVRWLVAARMGAPVQITWEFAYDWEVEPGSDHEGLSRGKGADVGIIHCKQGCIPAAGSEILGYE